MLPKLLFITSRYFYQSTLDALARLNLPCETTVIPYDDFSHIAQVYGAHADEYDACFTSGVIAKQAIELEYPNPHKPLIPFQIGPNALHRDILRVMLDTQYTDLNRIAMDFLIALGSGYSVADFLLIEDLEHAYADNALLTRNIGTYNGYTIENHVVDRIISLWNSKAIDLVICQYSSIIPRLQELGIPYRCSFVSDRHLNALIQEALVKLELQKLHDKHPVIIQVFPRQNSTLTEDQYTQLHKEIQSFIKANLLECILQDSPSCCVLITSMKILRFLTDEFRSCRITAHLSNVLDFPVLVAYGVGGTVSHAMNNVQIASKEAKITGNPFIVDSNGCLIGPLNSKNHMVVTSQSMPDVADIAKRCGLSSMTIHKIMSILVNIGSNKITIQDLALHMHTTVRNANRIMQHLCSGGAASAVYTQATHSRGRPVQVYALDFGSKTSK